MLSISCSVHFPFRCNKWTGPCQDEFPVHSMVQQDFCGNSFFLASLPMLLSLNVVFLMSLGVHENIEARHRDKYHFYILTFGIYDTA